MTGDIPKGSDAIEGHNLGIMKALLDGDMGAETSQSRSQFSYPMSVSFCHTLPMNSRKGVHLERKIQKTQVSLTSQVSSQGSKDICLKHFCHLLPVARARISKGLRTFVAFSQREPALS